MKLIAMVLLICITSFYQADAAVVRRAAFDFGSGKMKVQVADIDTEKHEIVNIIYTEDRIVLLSDDAAKQSDGAFSEEIQNKAVQAASELKKQAIAHGAQQFTGVATEAYRKAINGYELIDRYYFDVGITARIISQEEEGHVGFLALAHEAGLDQDKIVVWDIGGGSFQVTFKDDTGNLKVYMGPFGRMTTRNQIIKEIKQCDPSQVTTPNPISQKEWNSSVDMLANILPDAPIELVNKLKHSDVELIGISAHPEALRKLSSYQMSHLLEILEMRLNKSDQDLAEQHKSPSTAISELCLIYSILKKLDADTVRYIRTNSGSSSAILLTESYWN